MIIGSGLLAKAFLKLYASSNNVCIFASGVSDSQCSEQQQFKRENDLLVEILSKYSDIPNFVYFSTCSIGDNSLKKSKYVKHKLAMEALVLRHSGAIVFRLPQIASNHLGNSKNLLNYIYGEIINDHEFTVYEGSYRNIIDIEDIRVLVECYLNSTKNRQQIVNIANIYNYSIFEIVTVMEKVIGKQAMYKVTKKGEKYLIGEDDVIKRCRTNSSIIFDESYLYDVLHKYYTQ